MCVNANTSIFSFIFSIVSSIILILYGNKKYYKENIATGLFLIYVGFMQLFEYLMWIDIDNKKKYNRLGTIFGSIFNYSQPTVLFFLNTIISNKHNLLLLILNGIYYIYFLISLNNFFTNEIMQTNVVNNHLLWKWLTYFDFRFYALIFTINIFTLYTFNYALLFFLIGFITLIVSARFFKENVGEIWCFFASYILIIICCLTYFI